MHVYTLLIGIFVRFESFTNFDCQISLGLAATWMSRLLSDDVIHEHMHKMASHGRHTVIDQRLLENFIAQIINIFFIHKKISNWLENFFHTCTY